MSLLHSIYMPRDIKLLHFYTIYTLKKLNLQIENSSCKEENFIGN